MKVFPAIDLKDNKCVRLTKGKDSTSKVFNKNPKEQAIYFQDIGCSKLHVVDLDAAFGRPEINLKSIEKIRNSISIPIQIGGGIRTKSNAEKYFDLGINEDAKDNSFKALKIKPDDGDIQKTLSFIYLKDHDFEKGWGYFEGRLNLNEFVKKNENIERLNKKLFRKKILNNSKNKYLVIREQGVGDEILYGSMYGDLLKKVENVLKKYYDNKKNLKFIMVSGIFSEDHSEAMQIINF